ncbi:MAG: valine--tRNA ligase [Dehalococcoidia bacterium]|nr:valine--tRNA ligase [Dehalococcoidia bacterium]
MTARGQSDIPGSYEPKDVEAKWYQFWLERGYFTPDIEHQKKPFIIIMPPPNVTGELHLGTAFTAVLEDIMIRWHRMKGEPTLWLPGSDHAGIAGQNVVEQLLAREGLSRHDLGREKFLERMWEWMDKYRGIIVEQHRRLGASCDFTRERFTMDPGPSRAVRTTFFNLYKKGLIYRGERIINWCPRCATALSDLEVEHKELSSHLYYVRYRLEEGDGQFITVATTRPETILGDTAVAVNPDDIRHKSLLGKMAILPALGRKIPIIADGAVDPSFGTGAVKITPAHDPVDFDVAQRQNLPSINILTLDARMNENAGSYAGLDRFDCRKELLADLEKEGLLVKIEPYQHSVGHCQRCDTMVEPLLSKQWFVNTAPLAKPAIEAVVERRIEIIPERFTKVYLNWMENIRDWCISRQLWWGHRIPVWYCGKCDGGGIHIILREGFIKEKALEQIPYEYSALRQLGLPKDEIAANTDWVIIDLSATPIVSIDPPTACPNCGSRELLQDPDVLDTWFSSALWPHSTLGWPEETEDLKYFYPTTVMETGYDILFFWVARMIMMGLENTGDIPFRYVYLHGLIRDETRTKMSKSRGNVIDPVKSIEKYGTDALRFALSTGNSPGNDMLLGATKLEGSRNFTNKLWNAARFVISSLDGAERAIPSGGLPAEDRWILSRLNRLISDATGLLESFQFGEALRRIYEFLWTEYCDWYIEIAKIRLRNGDETVSPLPVLVHVLETSLRLLHPYMPFITEEIWQRLKEHQPEGKPDSIMIAPYPTADTGAFDDDAEREMESVIEIIRSIRNARVESKVAPAKFIEAFIAAGEARPKLEAHAPAIATLARVRPLTILDSRESGEVNRDRSKTLVLKGVEVILPLEGMIDLDDEKGRLLKEIETGKAEIGRIERLLADEKFLSKAPASVVDKERQRLSERKETLGRLEEMLAGLG